MHPRLTTQLRVKLLDKLNFIFIAIYLRWVDLGRVIYLDSSRLVQNFRLAVVLLDLHIHRRIPERKELLRLRRAF